MPPVLVLLNGLPGSGKSTLARAWADAHAAALPLALDVDVLRSMLGGWRDRPLDAGLAARAAALAAVRAHLASGRDVVVPQLVHRAPFAEQLAGAAAAAGAAFVHAVLDVPVSVAADRLAARTGAGAEGALEQPLEAVHEALERFLADRPGVVRISGNGIESLDRAIEAQRGSAAAAGGRCASDRSPQVASAIRRTPSDGSLGPLARYPCEQFARRARAAASCGPPAWQHAVGGTPASRR